MLKGRGDEHSNLLRSGEWVDIMPNPKQLSLESQLKCFKTVMGTHYLRNTVNHKVECCIGSQFTLQTLNNHLGCRPSWSVKEADFRLIIGNYSASPQYCKMCQTRILPYPPRPHIADFYRDSLLITSTVFQKPDSFWKLCCKQPRLCKIHWYWFDLHMYCVSILRAGYFVRKSGA